MSINKRGGGGGGGGGGNQPNQPASSTVLMTSREVQILTGLHRPLIHTDESNVLNNLPLKNGFQFYEWLSYNLAELKVPIPDTFISSTSTWLSTNINNNSSEAIVCEKLRSESPEDIDSFITRFCISCSTSNSNNNNENSKSLLRGAPISAPSSASLGINPIHHLAGVMKTRVRQQQVEYMRTELLFPFSVQAHLLNALVEKNAVPMVIQRYIKSRGARASVYRVLYRSARDDEGTAGGGIKGWCISRTEDFRPYVRTNSGGALEEEEDGAFTSLDDVRNHIQRHPRMTANQRVRAVSQASEATYTLAAHNLCSLTEQGAITADNCRRLVVGKLLPSALGELEVYASRVAQWIQTTVLRRTGLQLHVASVTCDFIRDDDSNWWLVKVHAYRVTAASRVRLSAWHRLVVTKQQEQVGEEGIMVPEEDATERVRLQQRALTKVPTAVTGYLCRMCGVHFSKHHTILHKERETDEEVVKPAFGYMLTSRQAAELAAVYRDFRVPLTETSKLLLVSRIQGMARQLLERRYGAVMCCYYCCHILEAHRAYLKQCADYLSMFGVIDQQEEQEHSQGQNHGQSTELSYTLMHTSEGGERRGGARLDIYSAVGQPSQWRVLFLFRCLTDLPSTPSSTGQSSSEAAYCLSYTLGNKVTSITFSSTTSSAPMTSDTVLTQSTYLPIKQCRVHYLFGNSISLRELFATKRIALHVFSSSDRAAKATTTAAIISAELLPGVESGSLPVPSSMAGADYEGVVDLSLERLRWQHQQQQGHISSNSEVAGEDGGCNGSEKIDIAVPVPLGPLGSATLLLSIAVIRDVQTPAMLSKELLAGCRREGDVYWPPRGYHDSQLLPETWVSMMYS